jgi:hypothetical protein
MGTAVKERCQKNSRIAMLPDSNMDIYSVRVNRIIGGLFGLECEPHSRGIPPPFLTGKDIYLVNARSGIWLLVNWLRPRQVWVPSYLCHTILGAIVPKVAIPRFYEVDYDLKVRSEQWVSEVASGDLVIFIDYFGFPYDKTLGARIKEKGAWVLEDASQALLSAPVGHHSDFALYSPRKWIGVPDGGILRLPEDFPHKDIYMESPEATWWMKAFYATVLRREFDEGLPTREWFQLFRESEDAGPTGPYAMSQLSRAIIEYSVDYTVIAERRRENYHTLLEGLANYALFPEIDPAVVPLGFPVRIDNRDSVRQSLFKHEIYPPVHWTIEGVVPPRYEDSHRLAREIMTIPCDQRYTTEDMERIKNIFIKLAQYSK